MNSNNLTFKVSCGIIRSVIISKQGFPDRRDFFGGSVRTKDSYLPLALVRPCQRFLENQSSGARWSVNVFGLEVRVETPGEGRPDMVRGSLACNIFRKKSLKFWAKKGPSKKCFQKLII